MGRFMQEVLGFRLTEQVCRSEGHQLIVFLERSRTPARHRLHPRRRRRAAPLRLLARQLVGHRPGRRHPAPERRGTSTSGPPATASPAATRSTSSIRSATATRSSAAATTWTPTWDPSPGPRTSSARASSTTRAACCRASFTHDLAREGPAIDLVPRPRATTYLSATWTATSSARAAPAPAAATDDGTDTPPVPRARPAAVDRAGAAGAGQRRHARRGAPRPTPPTRPRRASSYLPACRRKRLGVHRRAAHPPRPDPGLRHRRRPHAAGPLAGPPQGQDLARGVTEGGDRPPAPRAHRPGPGDRRGRAGRAVAGVRPLRHRRTSTATNPATPRTCSTTSRCWCDGKEMDVTAAFFQLRHRSSTAYERSGAGDRPGWMVEMDRFWKIEAGGGDPITHWLNHAHAVLRAGRHGGPPLLAGHPRAVAEHPGENLRMFVCSHSGPIRAVATPAVGHDPGEPYNLEDVRIRVLADREHAIVTYRGEGSRSRSPPPSRPAGTPDPPHLEAFRCHRWRSR